MFTDTPTFKPEVSEGQIKKSLLASDALLESSALLRSSRIIEFTFYSATRKASEPDYDTNLTHNEITKSSVSRASCEDSEFL